MDLTEIKIGQFCFLPVQMPSGKLKFFQSEIVDINESVKAAKLKIIKGTPKVPTYKHEWHPVKSLLKEIPKEEPKEVVS